MADRHAFYLIVNEWQIGVDELQPRTERFNQLSDPDFGLDSAKQFPDGLVVDAIVVTVPHVYDQNTYGEVSECDDKRLTVYSP